MASCQPWPELVCNPGRRARPATLALTRRRIARRAPARYSQLDGRVRSAGDPAAVHRGDARRKVQLAEDAWNSCDPERVALAYTEDSQWRNRDEFFSGRDAIRAFLRRKWRRELDYRLRKELWAFAGNHISVRFEYECRDPPASGGAATATSTGSSTSGAA